MSSATLPPAGPLKPPKEKAIQAQITALLRASGFVVRNTSQVRPSMVAEGIPDLIIHHVGIGRGGWFEVKRPRVKGYDPRDRATWIPEPLRPEQRTFGEQAYACGQIFGWGGVREAEQLLLDLGLAFFNRGVFTLRPNGPPRGDLIPRPEGSPSPEELEEVQRVVRRRLYGAPPPPPPERDTGTDVVRLGAGSIEVRADPREASWRIEGKR